MTAKKADKTEVLYNADCPVCSYEIDHYARIVERDALAIAFSDLNNSKDVGQWGLTADQAARRLHVRKNGKVFSGIPAFIALWQDMPRYRWLARLVATPGIHRLAVWTYDYVLAPLLYRWHLKRTKHEVAG